MKIAYLTSYLGREFLATYGVGKKFALSGPLKSQGIARALVAAGHDVTIYSPGVTTCNAFISSFTEIEEYPEGKLTIKYCDIISKRRCGPINDWRISRLLKRESHLYDAIVYYNITLAAAFSLKSFANKVKIFYDKPVLIQCDGEPLLLCKEHFPITIEKSEPIIQKISSVFRNGAV